MESDIMKRNKKKKKKWPKMILRIGDEKMDRVAGDEFSDEADEPKQADKKRYK